MNKIAGIGILLVLAGNLSVYAQSGGVSKRQTGPVDYSRKANNRQTQGKGIPSSKDKQQQGRVEVKGGSPSVNGSSTNSGSPATHFWSEKHKAREKTRGKNGGVDDQEMERINKSPV